MVTRRRRARRSLMSGARPWWSNPGSARKGPVGHANNYFRTGKVVSQWPFGATTHIVGTEPARHIVVRLSWAPWVAAHRHGEHDIDLAPG